ncbi:g1911 [Coccomyxa elongata]
MRRCCRQSFPEEKKRLPRSFLTTARCPVEEGDGEPPLKYRRTGNVVQTTVPRRKHWRVVRRLLEPKSERPASGESSGTGVVAGSGGTETASIVDLLEQLKAVRKDLAAESDRACGTKKRIAETQARLARTRARLAGTQADLAGTQDELAGTQAQLARTQAEVAVTKAWVAGTETRVEGALAQLAWDREGFEGTRAQLHGIQARVAAYQVQLAAISQVAQKARTDLIQQRPFAQHLASLFN